MSVPDDEAVRSADTEGGGVASVDALEELVREAPRRWRRRWFILAGVGVWVVVVWLIGWRAVGEELRHARAGWVAMAAAVIFAGNWARAWKWRYALGAGENAAGIFFLSRVAAEVSPGRLGEFSPLAFKRHRKYRVGAWILLDRFVEMAVTLALGVAALGMLRLAPWGVYGAAAAAVGGGCALGWFVLTRRGLFESIAGRLPGGSYGQRFAGMIAAVSGELQGFGGKMPLAILVTVIVKVTDLWAVALLFWAFGHGVSLELVAAAKCAMAIVSFVPVTPVAIGIPHMTQAGLMHYVEGVPLEGLAAVIGVEVVIVSASLWISGGLAAGWLGKRAG